MKPLVIYHADCTDGFGAAFAAWLKLGDEVIYQPMAYADTSPDVTANLCRDREVYILDFSFKKLVMEHIFEAAKRVVWLDHHKTAFEMWVGEIPEEGSWYEDTNFMRAQHVIRLDNNKSGARLAWEYFHPDKEVPLFIQYIDDRDRWQFKLDGSKAFHAAIGALKPWNFHKWFLSLNGVPFAKDVEARTDEGAMRKLLGEGAAILRAQDAAVASTVKNARRCVILKPTPPNFSVNLIDGDVPWVYDQDPSSGYIASLRGLAVNTNKHMSEVGHELANQSGTFGLVWYMGADNRIKCSLRSNGEYDVSAIAKVFGGGGHKNAAGFETDINTLMGWLV